MFYQNIVDNIEIKDRAVANSRKCQVCYKKKYKKLF